MLRREDEVTRSMGRREIGGIKEEAASLFYVSVEMDNVCGIIAD